MNPNSKNNYREGLANLKLGRVFFRPSSVVARDLSVLIASMQLKERSNSFEPLKWLDLMAGSGIRSLRWGLEVAIPNVNKFTGRNELEIWTNDADIDNHDLTKSNLNPIKHKNISCHLSNERAEKLLAKAYLDKQFFNLIDLDCFGCPNAFLQPTLQVLAFDGVLMLCSTNSRSATGRERQSALRQFGSSVRAHPSSWELALRNQLGSIAKTAWLLGRGIEPLLSFSDGRTFRTLIRFKRFLSHKEEINLGFIARCNLCGDQSSQALIALNDWKSCNCKDNQGNWLISGPLWIGSLQNSSFIDELQNHVDQNEIPIVNETKKLIGLLKDDPGYPALSWSTSELAGRLSLSCQPPMAGLIKALRQNGYIAFKSGVMKSQLRTNAPFSDLLRIFQDLI